MSIWEEVRFSHLERLNNSSTHVVLPALLHVDYCILTEFEISRTTGIQVRRADGFDLEAIRAAAYKLIEAGVRQWVIVHFPEGAYALGPDGKLHTQGSLQIPQTKIVSTVGAGDAFAAGVLYGLHEGRDRGNLTL